MADDKVSVGELLLGKYRVERVLGQGAMGLVVAARHVELRELFAIKCLLPHATGRPEEAEQRFLREARLSARLKGPHVTQVYDVGRLPAGTPYMVMEHLSGTDLYQLLKASDRPLPIGEVLTYALQLCEAVAEAHELGIVHRDLKPANVFLTRLPNGAPCIKVLDFGISKQLGGGSGDLTATGTLLGSPSYMSPEQMKAKAVDTRSDIWAIGAVLFELLTGRPPFVASSFPAMISMVVTEAPPPPRQLRGDVPPDLERIVLRCLQKNPDDRFQKVADLMAELSLLAAPRPSRAPNTPAVVQEAPAPVPQGPVAPAIEDPPSDDFATVPRWKPAAAEDALSTVPRRAPPAAPNEGRPAHLLPTPEAIPAPQARPPGGDLHASTEIRAFGARVRRRWGALGLVALLVLLGVLALLLHRAP